MGQRTRRLTRQVLYTKRGPSRSRPLGCRYSVEAFGCYPCPQYRQKTVKRQLLRLWRQSSAYVSMGEPRSSCASQSLKIALP